MIVDHNPKKPTITGTLYLHGTPNRFNEELARALHLESERDLLDLDITVDVMRSIKNRHAVYRVRYTIPAAGSRAAARPAGTGTLDWLFSWFRSPGSAA